MSRYSQQPLDFANLKTVGLEERGGKVKVADFATAYQPGSGIASLLDRSEERRVGKECRSRWSPYH